MLEKPVFRKETLQFVKTLFQVTADISFTVALKQLRTKLH